MERIKDAIERMKESPAKLPLKTRGNVNGDRLSDSTPGQPAPRPKKAMAQEPSLARLDRAHLQDMRIIAYDGIDRRTTHYDMLRTQVLQILEEAELQTIAVTSPRPNCGKTITSLNLAFSIARQKANPVLVVDLDMRKPMIANYLGVRPLNGIEALVEGHCTLDEAIIKPDLAHGRLSILATTHPVANPTELIVSSQMKTLIQKLKKDSRFSVIVFDLPPMLTSDDFLAFLPQTNSAMLVAAAGESTVHEIAECERLIGEDRFLGCVLNKSADVQEGYSYYS